MKIYSWNINGLRAILNKGALQKFLSTEQPDVLCLQEIKCKPEQCDCNFTTLGYNVFWNPAKRPGYSGTAILVRAVESSFSQPRSLAPAVAGLTHFESVVTDSGHGFEKDNFDSSMQEGRVLTLEFENFYLVNVYTPNSKPDLSRLTLREQTWDPAFLTYLKQLEQKKPVITCGDFNAAHTELDLARPKTNHHSAGFTDAERQGITNLLNAGFIDTFRSTHPNVARYTWWSHWGHARENNIGWRIDYFFISTSLKAKLNSAKIHEQYLGSDHCPISIEMEF